MLFGDGAGAVVVGGADLDLGIAGFDLSCDGDKADLLYADQTDRVLRMEGQEVYRHAVARMVESTHRALRRARRTVDDLDLFVAHQANARIVEAAAAELGIDPGQGRARRGPRRQHVLGVDPARPGAGRARGTPATGIHRRLGGVRSGLRVGCGSRELEGACACLRLRRRSHW